MHYRRAKRHGTGCSVVDVLDVIEVRVTAARPGDWLVDAAGDVVATIRFNAAGILMADFGDHFDWHWSRSRIDGDRPTVPVPEALRSTFLRRTGQRLRGAVLELVRQA